MVVYNPGVDFWDGFPVCPDSCYSDPLNTRSPSPFQHTARLCQRVPSNLSCLNFRVSIWSLPHFLPIHRQCYLYYHQYEIYFLISGSASSIIPENRHGGKSWFVFCPVGVWSSWRHFSNQHLFQISHGFINPVSYVVAAGKDIATRNCDWPTWETIVVRWIKIGFSPALLGTFVRMARLVSPPLLKSYFFAAPWTRSMLFHNTPAKQFAIETGGY